jgi:hypothetical protein
MHEALIISIPPDIFLIITAAQCGMMQAARSASNVNLHYLFHKNQLIYPAFKGRAANALFRKPLSADCIIDPRINWLGPESFRLIGGHCSLVTKVAGGRRNGHLHRHCVICFTHPVEP